VNWNNTHVDAGNQLTLKSGNDTTLKGAVATGKQITADIGGNLTIESLQDTSTYTSKQSSAGFSASIPIYGTGGSASVNVSKSKIDSDYASVTEQSGIKAGDGGFKINVQGNTDLTGGAITSTRTALDHEQNRFTTGGTLTTSDIQNRANYSAKAVGVNLGTGVSLDGKLAPQGTSAGLGRDSGNASSLTQAAITGIAGNKEARTGDKETGIGQIFDADKVQKEINAQVQITQEFGRQASKAVGDYAQGQRNALHERAKSATAAEEKEIQTQLNDLATQERVMNVLIGAVSGMGGTALTKETLSAAADEMRQIMIEDSKKFAGVVDKEGKPLFSNISGRSEGVNGDGLKIAGTRADLDLLCGADSQRCFFEKNPDGLVDTSKPVKFIGDEVRVTDGTTRKQTFEEFLQTEDGQKLLSAPFGGLQGGNRTWLFGVPYEKGGWVDKLLEAFAGPHDLMGGRAPGLYDEQGNIKRGMSSAESKSYDVWSSAALAPAAPFAAAQVLPPEVWKAVSILLKAGQ